MSPPLLLTLMIIFLAYAVFRAVVYFRLKKPQIAIAVVFICCIVLYEIVRLILKMTSGQA